MRTKEAEAAYRAYRAQGGLDNECRLCEAPAQHTFTHWKVIENKFPYDMIAESHDMLVPLAHHSTKEVTPEAWAELATIKEGLIHKKYDFIIEATQRRLSIPAHLHLHLVVLKKFE